MRERNKDCGTVMSAALLKCYSRDKAAAHLGIETPHMRNRPGSSAGSGPVIDAGCPGQGEQRATV